MDKMEYAPSKVIDILLIRSDGKREPGLSNTLLNCNTVKISSIDGPITVNLWNVTRSTADHNRYFFYGHIDAVIYKVTTGTIIDAGTYEQILKTVKSRFNHLSEKPFFICAEDNVENITLLEKSAPDHFIRGCNPYGRIGLSIYNDKCIEARKKLLAKIDKYLEK